MIHTGKIVSVVFNDANYEDKVELNLGDYEVIVEKGKTYVVKKKKEYPKTYEKCCDTLSVCSSEHTSLVAAQLDLPMNTFIRLLVARDAYWKIAGEERGLGKPWEPDE